MLPGTNDIFQRFAILHELIHAYIQTTGYYPSHEQMLGDANFNLLYGAARGLGLSKRDATALILYTSKDAEDAPAYDDTIDGFNLSLLDGNPNPPIPPLTKAEVQSIGRSYSNATVNSQGIETTIGGANCQ